MTAPGPRPSRAARSHSGVLAASWHSLTRIEDGDASLPGGCMAPAAALDVC
jgi:hypothetical protein